MIYSPERQITWSMLTWKQVAKTLRTGTCSLSPSARRYRQGLGFPWHWNRTWKRLSARWPLAIPAGLLPGLPGCDSGNFSNASVKWSCKTGVKSWRTEMTWGNRTQSVFTVWGPKKTREKDWSIKYTEKTNKTFFKFDFLQHFWRPREEKVFCRYELF